MAPNVYLHVSLLQPHAQTTNDLPIRMYGVMPVFVTDPQTLLHHALTCLPRYAPKQTSGLRSARKPANQ